MRRALTLAAQGRGWTSPNPMVGAVVVQGGEIVGEGFHARVGAPHAEVEALRQAGERARGATLYVTLEPCGHQGRTPPCTDAVIQAGIGRVVAATLDPNPLVAGQGVARLHQAGIPTEVGCLQSEAEKLNEAYLTTMRRGRPFGILKAAISLDGKIATRTGESRWISGPLARERVHRLRSEVDTIMVGIGTVLQDDPLLTVRLPGVTVKEPLRVVVDRHARTPLTARILHEGDRPPLIAVGDEAPADRVSQLERAGVEIAVVPEEAGHLSLGQLARDLASRGILSVLFEGGSGLYASAVGSGVVDRVLLMVAPILIGGREAPSLLGGEGITKLAEAWRIEQVQVDRLGPDLLIEGYLGIGGLEEG